MNWLRRFLWLTLAGGMSQVSLRLRLIWETINTSYHAGLSRSGSPTIQLLSCIIDIHRSFLTRLPEAHPEKDYCY